MNPPAAASNTTSSNRWSAWRKFRTLVVVLSLVGSAALNVLSVVSEGVHAALFGVVKAVSTAFIGEAKANRALASSAAHKFAATLNRHRAEAVKTVSSRVGKRLLMNSIRNVTSVAAEVVPMAGVPVILFVTGWDIIDNCQTLKDLNELRGTFDHESQDEAKVCGMKIPKLGGNGPPDSNHKE